MYEDSLCDNPCGLEPMGCTNCGNSRRLTQKPTYYPVYTPPKRIVKCKKCGVEIVWAKSHKTGKFYPIQKDDNGWFTRTSFHNCK